MIGDAPKYVGVVIKKTSLDRLYVHQVFDSDGISYYDKTSDNGASITAASLDKPEVTHGATISDVSETIIPEMDASVNSGKRKPGTLVFDSNGNNLTVRQAAYFSRSVVRDRDGHLLMLYHGTGAEFTVFDRKLMGKNGLTEGAGFYYTVHKKIADKYASKDGEGGKVLSGHVKITKALDEETPLDTDTAEKIVNRILSQESERAKRFGDSKDSQKK